MITIDLLVHLMDIGQQLALGGSGIAAQQYVDISPKLSLYFSVCL